MKTHLNYNIDSKIILNCWKHHKFFVRNEIIKYQRSKLYSKLQNKIKCIGDSRIDVYLGKLSSAEIIVEVLSYLDKHGLLDQKSYFDWIRFQKKHYQEIELSDGSSWTLLVGNQSDKYIHIHPSRYSRHTLRMNSATLKTVIFALTIGESLDYSFYSLDFMNKIRTDWLNLSPVKVITKSNGLGKHMVEFLKS